MANGAPAPKRQDIAGGKVLQKPAQAQFTPEQMKQMIEQQEFARMSAALTEPWRVDHVHKSATRVLYGENGYKLLQFGLIDGTRVEFEFSPEAAEVTGTGLLVTQEQLAEAAAEEHDPTADVAVTEPDDEAG